MIFSGSRDWGENRLGAADSWLRHEQSVAAQVIDRMVGRHVIGHIEATTKRDRSVQRGPGLVVIHGAARGLDSHIDRVAHVYGEGLRRLSRREFSALYVDPQLADGLWVEPFPADWTHEGKAAGGLRNQRMLDSGADQVIALFAHGKSYGPEARGGTNDCVRRAVMMGIPVDIYVADDRRWRKP